MNTSVEVLPVLLQKARETAVASLRATLVPFGLTEQQWRVIHTAYEREELNAQELAAGSAILGPSLSRILARLEDDGLLLRRVSAGDQRELTIKLSAKGKRLHNRILPKVEKGYQELAAKVGEAKLTQLSNLLNHLASLDD